MSFFDQYSVTDVDGNTYKTILIGNQLWMAENLRVTHYRNGEPIAHVKNDTMWAKQETGAYCFYENNTTYAERYGCLYNLIAVMDSQCVAPEGWHVPSDAEWQELIEYLGGDEVAGGKMKFAANLCWYEPNEGATNESGFSALPGGFRTQYGGFYGEGYHTSFWSSTEFRYPGWSLYWYYKNAATRMLNCKHSRVENYNRNRCFGLSVRCVKD